MGIVDPHTPDKRDVRGLVFRGVGWTSVAVASMQLSRVVVAVILARLLTPEEFGIAAMTLVFATLVLAMSDFSLGAALVQRPIVTDRDRSTLFWTSLVLGLLLSAGGVALAGPLASFYGEPQIRVLFSVLSLGFVFVALQTTQSAVLQRQMDFRSLTMRRVTAVIAGGFVAVTLALFGLGVWAFIGQQLTASIVSAALLWLWSPWRPQLTFSLTSLRELGGFGAKLFGARLSRYLIRNSDSLLIGRFLGASALGVYTLAYSIIILPLTRLVSPLQDVLYPAYSRLQEDSGRLAQVWLRVSATVIAVLAPLMLGFAVTAPDFVPIVLGSRWRDAVPLVQILVVVGLLEALAAMASKVLEALGKADTILRFTIVEAAIVVTAFVLGLRWGVVGVACSYLAVMIPLILSYLWLTTRALAVSFRALGGALGGVLQATAAMVVVMWLTRHFLVANDLEPGLRLALVAAVGAAVYIPMCAWRAPGVRQEISTIRARRRARALSVSA